MSSNSDITVWSPKLHSLLVFTNFNLRRAGCSKCRTQVPSCTSHWKSKSDIAHTIWHKNVYNFVLSSEDDCVMPCMPSITLHMPVSQRYNLDLISCSVPEDKIPTEWYSKCVWKDVDLIPILVRKVRLCSSFEEKTNKNLIICCMSALVYQISSNSVVCCTIFHEAMNWWNTITRNFSGEQT